MKGKYAVDTRVPVAQTRAEIERLLTRYGARQFVSGWDDAARLALVAFTVLAEDGQPRQVRMRLPLPLPTAQAPGPWADQSDVARRRRAERTAASNARAERAAWRSLLLVIKAKLEAAAAGISTIEREFMADIVLPDGRTLHEWAAPQIAEVYTSGRMPALLGDGR